MKNRIFMGMIVGATAGVVAGMILMPKVAPMIKRAMRQGRRYMDCKMHEMEDEF